MRRPIAILALITTCIVAVMAGAVALDVRRGSTMDSAVVAVWTAVSTAASTVASTGLMLAGSVADATVRFGTRLPGFIVAGYDHAPEMIIGLGTALSFPLVALGSFTFRWASRRRRDRLRALRTSRTVALVEQYPSSKARVWLEVNNAAGARDHDISGEMLRIGQDADNELALTDSGVQQFHALIRRTPEAEFIVIDVTGIDGSGIAVNGRRLRSSLLKDGDKIELGHTAMTFHRAVWRAAVRLPGN